MSRVTSTYTSLRELWTVNNNVVWHIVPAFYRESFRARVFIIFEVDIIMDNKNIIHDII